MFGMSVTNVQEAGVLARFDSVMNTLQDMSGRLEKATDLVYEHTREWFESWGDGTWPDLAESTVQRKVSQGYAEPQRPLYAEGSLFESVTSPYGPYSERIIDSHRAVILVDNEQNGWQIPSLLSAGGEGLPARPIWHVDDDLINQIHAVLIGDDVLAAA